MSSVPWARDKVYTPSRDHSDYVSQVQLDGRCKDVCLVYCWFLISHWNPVAFNLDKPTSFRFWNRLKKTKIRKTTHSQMTITAFFQRGVSSRKRGGHQNAALFWMLFNNKTHQWNMQIKLLWEMRTKWHVWILEFTWGYMGLGKKH